VDDFSRKSNLDDAERLKQVASVANELAYRSKDVKAYINGAPHIKHASLRNLYSKLVLEVYNAARQHTEVPRVLDLGAGEGSVTLPFLELGAKVEAVDISSRQMDELRRKCEKYGDRLQTRCEDINHVLATANERYDIVAANSFLHHIPDYLSLIKSAAALLAPGGQFFSFQDPLRYDSVGVLTKTFTDVAYLSWRISLGSKGDVLGGVRRRLRRRRGIYLEDSVHDNAEYHVTRNGVDQDAIRTLLEEQGFDCRIITYFSTQSIVFQPIGAALRIKNMFAVIARNRNVPAVSPQVNR
jgi:SAM-dependent methyltransferase